MTSWIAKKESGLKNEKLRNSINPEEAMKQLKRVVFDKSLDSTVSNVQNEVKGKVNSNTKENMAKPKNHGKIKPVDLGLKTIDKVAVPLDGTENILSRICCEAGFSPTGRVLKRYPATFFEQTTLLARLDRHLKKRMIMRTNCEHDRNRSACLVVQLRAMREKLPFSGGIVFGVAGSGKSTLLREIQKNPDIDSVCLLGNPDLKGDYAGIPEVFTTEEMLMCAVPSQFDVLLIDEYTLVHSAEILLLQRKLASRIVVLFGDREQGNTSDLTDPSWLHLPVIFQSLKSRRFGTATALLCSSLGFYLGSTDDVKDEVISADYEGEAQSTSINICFTKDTQEDLADAGLSSELVKNVQGKTFESVSLFVRESDKPALLNSHLKLVSVTRHRVLLVLRLEPAVESFFMLGKRKHLVSTQRYGEEYSADTRE